MKDVVTSYWFNYKMATIDMGDKPDDHAKSHILKTKYGIVTIHDVSPLYFERIFHFADELEKLGIPFNFAIIPCHNEDKAHDIRKHSEAIGRIQSYKQDLALHGLYPCYAILRINRWIVSPTKKKEITNKYGPFIYPLGGYWLYLRKFVLNNAY
jgi:uncharacterized protein DUF2334